MAREENAPWFDVVPRNSGSPRPRYTSKRVQQVVSDFHKQQGGHADRQARAALPSRPPRSRFPWAVALDALCFFEGDGGAIAVVGHGD